MSKKLVRFIIAIIALITIILHPSPSFADNSEISLLDLKPYKVSSYVYMNNWAYSQPFIQMDGSILTNGMGLTTYANGGGTSYASYNLKGMGYKTFLTEISLDSNYIVGDYGKAAIGFYADDALLYEKQLDKNSGIIPVNIKLPEKITNFHIILKEMNGGKGTYKVLLSNPTFSTNGQYLNNDHELPISLLTIGASDSSSYYYTNEWSNKVFQDIKGNLVTNGIGLTTNGGSGGTTYASYNIDNTDYNRFETKLSLDASYTVGDYGRSKVGIYADDYLLYEKELTPKTAIQSVKLNIPKGTKNLRVVGKQIKGAKGTHGIIFINPLLKKTKDPVIKIPKTIAVNTVGAKASSGLYYNYYTKDWGNIIFRYSNGQIPTDGVALKTYDFSDGTAYATYNISGMGFNSIKTKLSLDSSWLTGDYGKTTAYIYADKKLLYKRNLKKKDLKRLTIRFPSNTKSVTFKIAQVKGAKGTQGVVFGNAVFTNLPVSKSLSASKIRIINNKKASDSITISSVSKNDTIRVYNSKKQLLVSGKTTSNSITLKVKQLGSKGGKVYFTRTSAGKLESNKTAVNFRGE